MTEKRKVKPQPKQKKKDTEYIEPLQRGERASRGSSGCRPTDQENMVQVKHVLYRITYHP